MLKIKITHNYWVNLHNIVGANIIILCKYFIIIIIFISHLRNTYNIFYLDYTADNQINVVYKSIIILDFKIHVIIFLSNYYIKHNYFY